MVINVSNLFSQLSYDFVMIFVISHANIYFLGHFSYQSFLLLHLDFELYLESIS